MHCALLSALQVGHRSATLTLSVRVRSRSGHGSAHVKSCTPARAAPYTYSTLLSASYSPSRKPKSLSKRDATSTCTGGGAFTSGSTGGRSAAPSRFPARACSSHAGFGGSGGAVGGTEATPTHCRSGCPRGEHAQHLAALRPLVPTCKCAGSRCAADVRLNVTTVPLGTEHRLPPLSIPAAPLAEAAVYRRLSTPSGSWTSLRSQVPRSRT